MIAWITTACLLFFCFCQSQSFVWSGSSTGIQGMTELEICERTKDAWLRSVQDEFRTGILTEEAHAFLHGNPTMNSGSTLNGIARCLNAKCNNRITAATTKIKFDAKVAAGTLASEGDKCKAERASRKLVADDGNDSRFQEERCLTAPAVFPNNDSKYDVNKKTFSQFCCKSKSRHHVLHCQR